MTRRLEADVYLAGELPNLDGLVSVCCVALSDGMNPCGFIVNLGQGLASKKGKIHQRTTRCPQVNVQKCYTCRRCVRACPTHAIAISGDHAEIDPRKCIQCGKCVEVAHYGGITHDWNATPEQYSDAVARHAKGALNVLEEAVVERTGVDFILRVVKALGVALAGVIAQVFVHWAINLDTTRKPFRPNG